jgi:hypothetical protein
VEALEKQVHDLDKLKVEELDKLRAEVLGLLALLVQKYKY